MIKFHINKQAEPGMCEVLKGLCLFGGDNHHYSSLASAQKAAGEILIANDKRLSASKIKTAEAEDLGTILERLGIVYNPKTTSSILKILASDTDDNVRLAVAHHRNVTVNILETLALDTEEMVRWTVASIPKTSKNSLKLLAHDSQTSVRFAVAFNNNTSLKTLKVLAFDNDPSVRDFAVQNMETPWPIDHPF